MSRQLPPSPSNKQALRRVSPCPSLSCTSLATQLAGTKQHAPTKLLGERVEGAVREQQRVRGGARQLHPGRGGQRPREDVLRVVCVMGWKWIGA